MIRRNWRPRFGGRLGGSAAASIAVLFAAVAAAQQAPSQGSAASPPSPPSPSDGADGSPAVQVLEPTEDMQRLVRRLLLEHLPQEYDNQKKWNRTERMTVFRLKRDGRFRPGTVEKDMRHGRWRKYHARLVEPEKTLQTRVIHLRSPPGGPLQARIETTGRINAFVRVANWRRGVQLYSFAADADATLRITLDLETQLLLDPSRLPPDVLIRVRAADARIELLDFDLNALSELQGVLAEGLGEAVEGYLQEEVAEQNDKLVAKLNEALEKKQDRLRISFSQLADSAWRQLISK